MDLSNVAFNLIIILLPGVVATLIVKNLIIARNWNSFKFSVHTILLSGITYLCLQIINNIVNFTKSTLNNTDYSSTILSVWENSTTGNNIPFNEVFYASLLSIIIGLIAAAIINKKLINYIGTKINVSNKYGNENLFYEFFRNKNVSPVYLRDIENNITYHGYVTFYSESENIREIVLEEVDVYSYEDSKYQYTLPKIFFSRSILSNWTIELPNINKEENEKNNGEESSS